MALLEEQNATRVPWLVPIRHGRMAASPFTFYRGAARLMATDLAPTRTSGITVQLGGDAHLSNFGAYASPERRLVFDANDFDETLPGPWEWDLKRLATSVWIAAAHRGFDQKEQQAVTGRTVQAYRQGMHRFAGLRTLDLWYEDVDVDRLSGHELWSDEATRRRLARFDRKARSRDSLQALRRLTVEVDGRFRIRSDPPVLLPLAEIPERDPDRLWELALGVFDRYRGSLPDHRRVVLDRFSPVDVGVKVVGVGSVGTHCFVMLLEGRDRDDPLFLQIKEATASVLEEHLGPSTYDHAGRRVVEGQRLIQAASDIFLGWTASDEGRTYHVRQLRDWKGSVDVGSASPEVLHRYASLCGWTLARGHARTGDPIAIAAYLGTSCRMDRAVTAFAETYAAQNARDHAAFLAAVADGRLESDPDH